MLIIKWVELDLLIFNQVRNESIHVSRISSLWHLRYLCYIRGWNLWALRGSPLVVVEKTILHMNLVSHMMTIEMNEAHINKLYRCSQLRVPTLYEITKKGERTILRAHLSNHYSIFFFSERYNVFGASLLRSNVIADFFKHLSTNSIHHHVYIEN